MFSGSIVALVTPMLPDGELDLTAFRDLIAWHINAGTQGLVINGTTGESPTLTSAEKRTLLKIAVEEAAGKIPVIAGTGTNCTQTTITETHAAIAAGVDGCLIVAPYYNRPTQQGLFEHYKAISDACPIPILLYNVPKRTASDILPDTVVKLAHLSNIVGIKEASGDLSRNARLTESRIYKKDFILLSGDDPTALEFMRNGGTGVISVAANIVPDLLAKLCRCAQQASPNAEAINKQLTPLYTALGLEANPIPVKWALTAMGLIPRWIRLPLTALDPQYHAAMRAALADCGIHIAAGTVEAAAR